MEELYREYGELMIQHEILLAKVENVKKLIAQALNAPKEVKEPVKDDKKGDK